MNDLDAHLMQTYRRQPVRFVRGEGMHLYDSEGKRYLDFVAGIAVNALGHAHPLVAEAVAKQSSILVHTSNLYYTEPMVALSEKLCELLGWADGRVFFANSGAEANECAIKVARKWSRMQSGPHRYETIAAFGSFHGRTLETLAATGQPAKWEAFTPLPPGFVHVPFDDAPAVKAAITSITCSVLLEPVQGEGGVIVPSPEYLPSIRTICDGANLLFLDDEVQTGLGRTGRWFGFQHEDAHPDVITLAKALGNGLPIGACVARGGAAEALTYGDHATTMGGGPVVCAAALAVLEVIEQDDLVTNAAQMGVYLKTKLGDLGYDVRGQGLLIAIALGRIAASSVVEACRLRGLLVNEVGPSVVRLCPPLIVSKQDCDAAVSILGKVLTDLEVTG
ncbi:MAG: acetylornithine transaminase [Actinomycetota bacterium]